MPIYEYRCEGCGHQLEKLQSFSDDPLVACPACGADLLKRLISQTSFHLKGGGWYATDYKKGSSAPPPPAESKAPASPAPATTTASKSDGASSSST
ncbi:MAG: FmdB family transcriptional regulator [Deltaproteobacteria bacterium HGW-Deltaproteobacteria-14]|jgi:putative FmdB family regulatory protein|nr:MAG: FmdB family transcriptional regulator [Deltaproteobacteria bacterium HGW-Deltaproteobacteria-14]